MVELKTLEFSFSKKYQDVFEDIATLMFCTEIGLTEGVNRRISQKAIESDPVFINGKWFAYQAKYYNASTKLSAHKQDFIKTIEGAAIESVNDLYLFVNKDMPDKDHKTGDERTTIKEIEALAECKRVKLHWWTKSKIESSLDMPKFSYIKDIYWNPDSNRINILKFYEEAVKIIEECPESDVYGNISLKNGYIEPYIRVNGIEESVKEYLESWLSGDCGNHKITLLFGEPGHGKTSMCWKAMYDAHKSGWLSGLVKNVFNFSLNPVNTRALENDSFSIIELLSWGFERKNKIDIELCKDSLIFLDAYDELIECDGRIEFNDFIHQIRAFQKETCSHIVITSRSMAVNSYIDDIILSNLQISAYELQPIRHYDQLNWIELYKTNNHLIESEYDWDSYISKFNERFCEEKYDSLIGVPIIFRMIVAARLLPDDTTHITKLYDDLFDLTWDRHPHQIKNKEEKKFTKESVFKSLHEHALQVFLDNTDTAVIRESVNSPWIFSFYTKKDANSYEADTVKKRVGFLHRSFYQYFLAYEILSWYEKFIGNKDVEEFKNQLSNFARRKIDGTTLAYIKEIFERKNETNLEILKASFNKSYEILKDTDGFLALTDNNSVLVQKVIPLERANNIFWNIMSIASIIGVWITVGSINDMCIRQYDLSESVLSNSLLSGTNLNSAYLEGAKLIDSTLINTSLRQANLSHADLSGANLTQAILNGADLSGAKLVQADLRGADLREVNLRGAKLRGTNLSRTNLRGADLSGADLSEADLSGADLYGADLSQACLRGADLRDVSLRRAKLNGTNLCQAVLRDADLRESILYCAKLDEADLCFAVLQEANISDASLQKADLSHAALNSAILRGTTLILANLSQTVLSQAILISAMLSQANLSEADLSRANLSEADLSHANLCHADLSHAVLSKANFYSAELCSAKFIDASIDKADFSQAKLQNADLNNANLYYSILRGADFSHAKLQHANLLLAVLNETNLSEANFDEADLSQAYIHQAVLNGATFRQANLNGTNFSGTDLKGAIIQTDNLYGTIVDQDNVKYLIDNACDISHISESRKSYLVSVK